MGIVAIVRPHTYPYLYVRGRTAALTHVCTRGQPLPAPRAVASVLHLETRAVLSVCGETRREGQGERGTAVLCHCHG